MALIGENIHIISPVVKAAIVEKNDEFILDLVKKQVNCGINIIDLNIGPAKGALAKSMARLVNLIQENFPDIAISLDTTSISELKEGFEALKSRKNSFLNSASADPQRLSNTVALASEYSVNLIALTLDNSTGIPKTPEERLELAYSMAIAANENGIENGKIFLDPLVLPVCVDQAQASVTLNSIRMFKESFDPEIKTIIGLSNISNGCTRELRPLINRVFFTLALGAGLDAAIVDGLDTEIINLYNALKSGKNAETLNPIYFALYEMSKNFGELTDLTVDKNDPEQVRVFKTAQILLNKEIYTHSFV